MARAWLQRLARRLQRSWWQPRRDALATALLPWAGLYGLLWRWHQRQPPATPGHGTPEQVRIVVVGNVVVGGGGKTPTVIALVRALQAQGWRPGVISRGYGRATDGLIELDGSSTAAQCGDEPLLIRRGTGVPVVVGRDRPAAARLLCAHHPEVDVIVSDDGLQHRALRREVEVIVFDARGIGNGLLLPAGPLREPWPRRHGAEGCGPATSDAAAKARRDRELQCATTMRPPLVLYTSGIASTAQPGHLAERGLGPAVPLGSWLKGSLEGARALEALPSGRLLAVAGIAHPEAFFDALRARGLQLECRPLPDHHAFDTLPWPPGTPAVVLTEKDAVKLRGHDTGTTQVWVVGLDFRLPAAFVQDLLAMLDSPRTR